MKDTGAVVVRAAAAGAVTGLLAVAGPGRTAVGAGTTVRLQAAAAETPAAAAATTVARSALR